MTIKPYNFVRPAPLPDEVRRRLGSWLRSVTALAPKKWASYFPFPVELTYQEPDGLQAAEALEGLPEAAIAPRVAFGDGVETLLVLHRPLALVLVSGMVGDAPQQSPQDRDLTLVEDSLLDFFVQHLLLALLQETWNGSEPLRLLAGNKEPFPRWTRLFGPNDELVLLRFSVKTPCGTHDACWLIPRKGLIGRFQSRITPTEVRLDSAEIQSRLQALVQDVRLSITVKLGSTAIPLAQLSRLRVGDLVLLDQKATRPVTVVVEGKESFQGWPGRVGSRQALLIETVMGK